MNRRPRAGRLVREIQIEERARTVTAQGRVAEEWRKVAALRAEVIQLSTAEFIRNMGSENETVVTFFCRYRDGLKPGMRVIYKGQAFEIRNVAEIGRRLGMEIRCRAKAA